MPRPTLSALILGLVVLLAAACATAGQAPQRVGGPCRYDTFPGKATIVSTPETGPAGITFTFTPDQSLASEPLFRPQAVHTLELPGGQPATTRFARKQGLAPGSTLPCVMHIIRQGTCTPVMFQFPGLDPTGQGD